jgi:oxalate/formate antiporter
MTLSNRGWQLALGVIAMLAASSPQYVWALFVPPVQESLGVGLPALQVTIALFSIFQCAFGPLHGILVERFQARWIVAIGGVLLGLSWVLSSFVTSLPMFYVTYGLLSGVGTGFIFVATTNLVAQWFPDRRGFAVGMVVGSYGMGAILTTLPIDGIIKAYDYRTALLWVGVVLGVVCTLAGLGMRAPPVVEQTEASGAVAARRSYTPREMLKSPIFWLLFLMMIMVGTGGLMAISQIGVIAKTFGIGPATLVFGVAALPLALTLDRIANGASRPLFGAISDRIGREPTMALAFVMEAVGIIALLHFGSNPVLFVLLTGVVFLGWGEIFSLFPAAQADFFGPKHGAKNLGWLLIAVAVASVLGGPLAAYMFTVTGSWSTVFYMVSGLDVTAAVLALAVLRPLRLKALAAA